MTRSSPAELLLVCPEQGFQSRVTSAFGGSYKILPSREPVDALNLFIERRPAVLLLAMTSPTDSTATGATFAPMTDILALDPLVKCIVISSHSDDISGPFALSSGAHEFLVQPVDLEELRVILKRAFYLSSLQRPGHLRPPALLGGGFETLLGASPAMREVFQALGKVAACDAPVLLLGESGTGKEMAAKAIHARSVRKTGPFVVINCTALPPHLVESELFGHEKGAFTGAHHRREGRIESAEGGTLFLDEIGELSPLVQTKLLRFLQEHTIERVGGQEPIRVDTRVIAATHVDLDRARRENQFREDLYFRLAVVTIRLPPLRDRDGDICQLAKEFLRRSCDKLGRKGLVFSHRSLKAFRAHAWPGNVRELENRVYRAVIMAERKCLEPEDVELDGVVPSGFVPSLRVARRSVERQMVERALRKHIGRVAPAAAELNVSRPTFYELMNRLGIKRGDAGGP